jgi:hypothetical protein
MFVKMLYKSLKYIHSIFFTTCFNHTGPSSGNNLFQGIYCTAHNVTRTCRFLLIWCYKVSPFPIFLYCGCSVYHWVYRVCPMLVLCSLYKEHCFSEPPPPFFPWFLPGLDRFTFGLILHAVRSACCLFLLFLPWFTLRPWKQRRYDRPKRRTVTLQNNTIFKVTGRSYPCWTHERDHKHGV